MPELPEVETIKTGLNKLIVGCCIDSVDIKWARSLPDYQSKIAHELIGATITGVRRKAKMLIFELSSGYSLVAHLKMTGQMVFRSKSVNFGAGHPSSSLIGELPDRSTRVVFNFDNGSHLFFNDQRKFGWIRLLPSVEVPEIDFMKKVGPDPFDPDLSWERFVRLVRRRSKSPIKAVLLDQSVVSGIGNIYADESLYAARLHPAKMVNQISDEELENLFEEIKAILTLSIDKGGSTDKNYVDAEGKRGNYLQFAKVFHRQGQKCPRCHTVIVKTRVAGRGTHICPNCQIL